MAGLAQNLSFILLGEDRSASKAMSAAEATAQRVTGRIGGAFTKVGGIIGGEFGAVLDQVGAGITDMGSKAAKLSTVLEVAGGLATGAGLGLMQLGSGEKQASDQLDAAIKANGQSVSTYQSRIDKAISTNENFGHSAEDTQGAIKILTTETGNAGTALSHMALVTNLAAAQHMSLSSAASEVAKILGGNGSRVLTQYGITMQKIPNQVTAVASAQKALLTAQDKLSASQTKLTQLTDIDGQKKKLTLAQDFQLQNAQAAVAKANAGVETAQKNLSAAQDLGTTKTKAADAALDQLSQKLNGQAKASVNNFGAQVGVLKTKLVDWVDEVSGPVGQVLTGIGPLLSLAGVAVDIYKTKQEAATLAQIASNTATTASIAPIEGETAALDTGLTPAVGGASFAMTGMASKSSLLAGPVGIAAVGTAALYAAADIGTMTDAAYNNTIQFSKATDAASAYQKQLSLDQTGPKGLFGNAKTDRGQALQLTTGANEGVGQFFTSLGLGGLNQEFQGATASIQKIDASMASLVKNGNSKEAAEEFQKWADAAKQQGLSMDTLKAKFPDYEKALKDGSVSTSSATNTLSAFNDQLARTKDLAGGVGGGLSVSVVDRGAVAKHAAGGIVTKPQMGIVGESGPEAVIPLNAGKLGMGAGDTYQLTFAPSGPVIGGSANDVAKQLFSLFVNGARSGAISKAEFQRAFAV